MAGQPRPGAPSILPGGRVIAPIGVQYITGPGPFGLAISPSGKTLVSANSGPERFSLTLLDRDKSSRRLVRHMVMVKRDDPEESEAWRSVFMGLAFSGEHTLYCSEGNSGRIRVVNPSDESRKLLLDLNRDGYSDSFTGDLAFDPERKLLYALDQANFRLVTIDVNRRRATASLRFSSPRCSATPRPGPDGTVIAPFAIGGARSTSSSYQP